MKTEEDEAFDELAKRQGMWGGGFPAKRAMAADKLHWSDCAVHNGPAYPAGPCDCGAAQEPVAIPDDVRNVARAMQKDGYRGPLAWASKVIDFVADYAAAQPAQEPVACEQCKKLEEQVYDLLGQLKAANLKWSVAHPWVGLTDEEREGVAQDYSLTGLGYQSPFKAIEAMLKEKNK
jgi:hypothetical protein